MPVLVICKGYSDNVSSSIVWIYVLTPFDKDNIRAIPIIPIEPAKDVKKVLPFFVFKLLKLRDSDVSKDIDVFPILRCCGTKLSTWYGFVSSKITPSFNVTIRVAYSLASFGLWVTITTSLSLATSFNKSITCILVSLSKAPVGSSANKISGSLTNALAIATRCICPPDNWLGFLWICCPNPTLVRASIAFSLLCALEIPEIVSASSTLDKIVWCGIKL